MLLNGYVGMCDDGMNSAVPTTPPKIVAAPKRHKIECKVCTFLNAPDAISCSMCGQPLEPPTQVVQADGTWTCGNCAHNNHRGATICGKCATPFSTSIVSAAPAQLFCSQCGFMNDGENMQCVSCDNPLRSKLDKIGMDLRDSTNLLARDIGLNIRVKCPGCMLVCFVPPATAGIRCGTCFTYFASPTVGEITNFHMTRLTSSITSSVRGFFSTGNTSTDAQEEDAPVGRLIAIGQPAQQLQSTQTGGSTQQKENKVHTMPREDEKETVKEQTERQSHDEASKQDDHSHFCDLGSSSCDTASFDAMYPKPSPSKSLSDPDMSKSGLMRATVVPDSMAATMVSRQDVVKVEGDIVEL